MTMGAQPAKSVDIPAFGVVFLVLMTMI